MASAVGDYNNDGWLDYFVTNIRSNKFMVNMGNAKPFDEMSNQLGTGITAISWGANFADFDHDTDLDLYVSNGDLNPNCNPMANFYFENTNGHFSEKSKVNGINDYGIGRGSITFDMDNDGDLDLFVVNEKPVYPNYPVESTSKLFRNDSTKGNWLKVKLKGISADNQGIGARVEVHIGNLKMIREIDGGASSHLSQNSTIAHFGLGKTSKIDLVKVIWVGGKQQILNNPKVNFQIEIIETKDELWLSKYYKYIFFGFLIFLGFVIYYKARKAKTL